MKIRFENIPAELRGLNQWVAWRSEMRGGKYTKVPYSVKGGKASVTDPATWSSFGAAVKHQRSGRFDGVGFVLTERDPFIGIDLDHCINDGKLEPWAEKIILDLDSYTEKSPSGHGVRIFAKGTLPPGGRKKGHVEMYDRARYVTVTGNHLPGTPRTIESRQAAIEALHSRIFTPKPKEQRKAAPPSSITMPDKWIIARASHARNGPKFRRLFAGEWRDDYDSRSEADQALCFLLAFWTRDAAQIDRILRRSGLMREKWDTPHYADGQTYGEHTIANALELVERNYFDEKPRNAVVPPPLRRPKDAVTLPLPRRPANAVIIGAAS